MNEDIVAAIMIEQTILEVYREALFEEFRGRRRYAFMDQIRGQIRDQGFRIAALQRRLK